MKYYIYIYFIFVFLCLNWINIYNKKYKIIIITLYFPIKNHHHSIDKYIQWSKLYFNIVKCDVFFFTSQKFRNITPKSKNIHSFYFINVTSIPIIKMLNIENMIQNNLYQIYHSKIAIVYDISIKYKANFYFFNDISTFHFKELENVKNYPNPQYIKAIFDKISTPILFTIHHNKHSQYFIQGGCFGGKRSAIKYLYDNYYIYLKHYYNQNGNITITEEELLDSLIYRINDSILIPNNLDKCKLYKESKIWFYYINVLSGYPKKCVKSLILSHLIDY